MDEKTKEEKPKKRIELFSTSLSINHNEPHLAYSQLKSADEILKKAQGLKSPSLQKYQNLIDDDSTIPSTSQIPDIFPQTSESKKRYALDQNSSESKEEDPISEARKTVDEIMSKLQGRKSAEPPQKTLVSRDVTKLESAIKSAQEELLKRGNRLLENGNNYPALESYQALLDLEKLAPIDPKIRQIVLCNQGSSFFRFGLTDQAIDAYMKASALDLPASTGIPEYNLGILFSRQNDPLSALQHYNLALSRFGLNIAKEEGSVSRKIEKAEALSTQTPVLSKPLLVLQRQLNHDFFNTSELGKDKTDQAVQAQDDSAQTTLPASSWLSANYTDLVAKIYMQQGLAFIKLDQPDKASDSF